MWQAFYISAVLKRKRHDVTKTSFINLRRISLQFSENVSNWSIYNKAGQVWRRWAAGVTCLEAILENREGGDFAHPRGLRVNSRQNE